jgi:hypothetical protein
MRILPISAFRHLLSLALSLAALSTVTDALACACCSDRGSRYIASEPMSENRLRDIGEMVFAQAAFILTRESDELGKAVKGLGAEYTLIVERQPKAIVFSFRHPNDGMGTLTLALPDTISIFEVDPRGDTKDEGLGPLLYKEWSLTAKPVGTGLFAPAVKVVKSMTLVLHGRGRGCTEPADFTDWTLVLAAGSGSVTLFGALSSAAR